MRRVIVIAALLALEAAGCRAFAVDTPTSFVSLERFRTRRYYKAVSPDNAVITITAFKHRDRGTLEYWTEVIRREMTLQKGYKLTGTEDVRTAGGAAGKQLRFTAQNGSVVYHYLATVFVTPGYIHVIEAAATKKTFPKHEQAIKDLIASFRPR